MHWIDTAYISPQLAKVIISRLLSALAAKMLRCTGLCYIQWDDSNLSSDVISLGRRRR